MSVIATLAAYSEDGHPIGTRGYYLDTGHVCAYFNFRVRIVDGLGLQVSDETAVQALRARHRAGALAKEKGVELQDDVWNIRD